MLRARPALRAGDAPVIIGAILLGIVPFGSMLFLASAASRCTEYLKKAGVRIGLSGAERESLEEAIRLRSERPLPTYGPEFER